MGNSTSEEKTIHFATKDGVKSIKVRVLKSRVKKDNPYWDKETLFQRAHERVKECIINQTKVRMRLLPDFDFNEFHKDPYDDINTEFFPPLYREDQPVHLNPSVLTGIIREIAIIGNDRYLKTKVSNGQSGHYLISVPYNSVLSIEEIGK